MDEATTKTPMPKKSVMVTLMFGIESNAEAIAFKEKVDAIVKDIGEKRYRFEINES